MSEPKRIFVQGDWFVEYYPASGIFVVPETRGSKYIELRLSEAYALADTLLAIRAWGVEAVADLNKKEDGPVDGNTNPSRYDGDRTAEG